MGILTYECLTGTTPFVAGDPMEGYRKIIKCRVPWPAQLSASARDFIDKLLTVDPTRRLGCLKGGAKDVRQHPWYQGLDFRALESKQLPAPYVPKIKSATDDSNFQFYEDDGIRNYPQESPVWRAHLTASSFLTGDSSLLTRALAGQSSPSL